MLRAADRYAYSGCGSTAYSLHRYPDATGDLSTQCHSRSTRPFQATHLDYTSVTNYHRSRLIRNKMRANSWCLTVSSAEKRTFGIIGLGARLLEVRSYQTGPNDWRYKTATVRFPSVQPVSKLQLSVVVARPRFACHSQARTVE
jgi:hypothetical protein